MSRRARGTLMQAAMLIAVLPGTAVGYAQTTSETGGETAGAQRSIDALRELRAAEEARLAAIEAETAVNGPFSPQLYDLYFSLATHYRERDDYALAAEALEQALHIQRVTHGLHSLEQVGVTQELIANSLATGDTQRAAELDIQLTRLARLNYDDVRSAEILSDAADRQMEIYERYLAGELPPQITINYGSGPAQPYRDPVAELGHSSLRAARRNWLSAINILLRAGLTSDKRIVDLQYKLIESYFVEKEADKEQFSNRWAEKDRIEPIFQRGKARYERVLAYAAEANDIETAAEAMIGLADWHLLFQKYATALKLYADAHTALVRLGVSEEFLHARFNPDIPVVLPAFNPNPLRTGPGDRAGNSDASEYVNIKIAMSRYGRSRLRDLRISPDPPEESIENRIRRIVARSRFRPFLIDGEARTIEELEFRYYVDSDDS
jgi:hypothetical protein